MSESKRPWTAGPWEYIASNEHHGAYVEGPFGDVCDCYTMSNPRGFSVRNGGDSRPIPFQGDDMDANARLISSAPELAEALIAITDHFASVMGGPLARSLGLTFGDGIDGIPTIVAARSALRKAGVTDV